MNVLRDIPYTKKIYTHSNTFHADELMGIALLQQYIFKDDRVEITRTRDKAILEQAKKDPNTFVLDVGTVYDPANLNFDHHQSSMQEGWPDGIYYSSCGLIWKWLKENNVLKQHMNDETVELLEERFIKRVDAADNGQGVWLDGVVLSKFNRNDDSPDGKKQMSQFLEALRFAKGMLKNEFASVRSELKSKKAVEKFIANGYDKVNKVLVTTDNAGDYLNLALEATNHELNLIILPHSRDKWKLQTAPKVGGDNFSQKNPAPTEWRGRSDFTTMVHGKEQKIVFAHKTGFMTIVDGSLEDAKSVASYIVEWNALQNVAKATTSKVSTQTSIKKNSFSR